MQRVRNEIDESNEFLSFPMEYPNPQPPQTDAELLQLVRFIVFVRSMQQSLTRRLMTRGAETGVRPLQYISDTTEKNILDKLEREFYVKSIWVQEEAVAKDAAEKKLEEAREKLMSKIDEVTKIRQDVLTAQIARDNIETNRQFISKYLSRVNEEREKYRKTLNSLMDAAAKTEPNEPQ